MPYFKWVGVTISGDIKKGSLAAYSDQELADRLFSRGIALLSFALPYLPFSLQKASAEKKAHIFSSIFYLLSAGILVPDVFTVAAQQIDNPLLYDALYSWALDIKNGVPFDSAIKKQQILCDTFVESMLIVGNESGYLAQAVKNVSLYYQEKDILRKNIRAAVAMPLLTFVFFIGTVLFIFLFIMPRFLEMFVSMNIQLPPLTRYLMNMSLFVSSTAMIYVIIGLVLTSICVCKWLRRAHKDIWYTIMYHIPFFGLSMRYNELSQCLYALSLLLDSSMALVPALHVLEKCASSTPLKKNIEHIAMDVQSGILLGQAMGSVGIFPSDVISLISVGQESGMLAKSLSSAAMLCKDKSQSLLKRFVLCIQPLIIIILGFLIGLLIIAVYLPIMSISFSM